MKTYTRKRNQKFTRSWAFFEHLSLNRSYRVYAPWWWWWRWRYCLQCVYHLYFMCLVRMKMPSELSAERWITGRTCEKDNVLKANLCLHARVCVCVHFTHTHRCVETKNCQNGNNRATLCNDAVCWRERAKKNSEEWKRMTEETWCTFPTLSILYHSA